MQVLRARNVAEAHLYMDLRGCAPEPRRHRVVQRADELVTSYECTVAGERVTFEFVIQPIIDVDHPTPSTIIGPGEYLRYSDQIASTVPARPTGLATEQRHEARRRLELAAAAISEVLKFIPRDADRVPAAALHSQADRELLAREPGRFGKRRLEALGAAYRDLARRYT